MPTTRQLQFEAKRLGFSGYSHLSKDELSDLIHTASKQVSKSKGIKGRRPSSKSKKYPKQNDRILIEDVDEVPRQADNMVCEYDALTKSTFCKEVKPAQVRAAVGDWVASQIRDPNTFLGWSKEAIAPVAAKLQKPETWKEEKENIAAMYSVCVNQFDRDMVFALADRFNVDIPKSLEKQEVCKAVANTMYKVHKVIRKVSEHQDLEIFNSMLLGGDAGAVYQTGIFNHAGTWGSGQTQLPVRPTSSVDESTNTNPDFTMVNSSAPSTSLTNFVEQCTSRFTPTTLQNLADKYNIIVDVTNKQGSCRAVSRAVIRATQEVSGDLGVALQQVLTQTLNASTGTTNPGNQPFAQAQINQFI